MNAWTGLLKKEYHLSRTGYFIGLGIMIFIAALAYLASIRFGEPGIMLAISVMLVLSHMFYLPGHLFTSLNTEGKQLHLWLHTPQSARSLISAKLAISTVAMLVSLAISSLIAYFALINVFDTNEWLLFKQEVLNQLDVSMMDMIQMGLFGVIHLILLSINFTIWIIFLWTIYNLFKRKIGRLSWLVVIVTIAIPTWLFSKFQGTVMYDWLTNWGRMELKFLPTSGYSFTGNVGAPHVHYVHLGDYVIHLIILVGIFFLSTWLLDEKVEV